MVIMYDFIFSVELISILGFGLWLAAKDPKEHHERKDSDNSKKDNL